MKTEQKRSEEKKICSKLNLIPLLWLPAHPLTQFGIIITDPVPVSFYPRTYILCSDVQIGRAPISHGSHGGAELVSQVCVSLFLRSEHVPSWH
jgi:hypothetical protein